MRKLLALAVSLCAAALEAQTPRTELTVVSMWGPGVAPPGEYRYTDAGNLTIEKRLTSNGAGVDITVIDRKSGDQWEFDFGGGQTLAVGFHPGDTPEIRFHNIGCINNGRGSVTVLDAQIEYAGPTTWNVKSFAARFEQVCSSLEESFRGEVYINYTPTVEVALARDDLAPHTSVNGTVTLTAPAPAGGATVYLASSRPDVVSVPEQVQVPAGETAAAFVATTAAVPADTRVEVLAIYEGVAGAHEVEVLAPVQPITRIELDGDRGHWVGDGLPRTFTRDTGVFVMMALRDGTYPLPWAIETRYYGYGGSFFSANLQARGDGPFPGRFVASLDPALSGVHRPTMRIGGNSRGCNVESGWFTVRDLKVDFTRSPAVVTSLFAEFEQQCDQRPEVLRGKIYFNYQPPRQRSTRK